MLKFFMPENDGEGIRAGLWDLFGLSRGEAFSKDQFASWLPYGPYVDSEQLFINRHHQLGFMLELMPQAGADERMVEVLQSLYTNCPANTGVQFHLFGSPDIRAPLIQYANMRMEDEDQYENSQQWGRPARNINLYRQLARQRVHHLLAGSQKSLTKGFHFTLRDFRLMMSVTVDGRADDIGQREAAISLRDSMASTLDAASIPSKECDAADLINWCALFTNPHRLTDGFIPWIHYDEGRELRDQIVDFDTVQEPTNEGIRFSKPGKPQQVEARFFSIKSFPGRFPLWQMGALIGHAMQPALQYRAPFLLTMGVHILDTNTTRTLITANHIRATQNAASKMAAIMPDVQKKQEDWSAVANAMDVGGNLVSMYHQLAIFCPPAEATAAAEAARAIWRASGFELNADVYMHRQALLASLPMTLTPAFHNDMKKMKRVTRKSMANAIHLAPLLGEWRGTDTPTLIFAGRRGQLVTLDLYDNDLGNYNFAVVGAPGSGKSVTLNEIAWSYRSGGAQVRLLDLGRSFEKLCKKANGTHVEFSPRSKIILNPFTAVNDIHEDIDMLLPALAKMCSMSQQLQEVQYKAISTVLLKLWKSYGNDLTITALRDEFKTGSIAELEIRGDDRIRDLAIMLNPYSKDGQYERFFEGKNNVDFSNDFVVIENEELKRKPDLHAVVNILLMYQITGEMYLNRDRKKLLIIDELKQQLGEIGADDPVKAAVVEEAARRARKYGGALGTATQGADDYYGSVQMTAAFNCSDWVFLLRQKPESIDILESNKRIVMDAAKKRLLKSLRTEAGAFAEMYVSSPIGEGVVRLVIDPATQLLFSNKLADNKPIDALRAQGYSIDEAIARVLAERGLQ